MFQYPPWTTLKRTSRGEVIGADGLIFAMLKEVQAKLNFTYIITPPTDHSFGIMKGKVKHVLHSRCILIVYLQAARTMA